MTIFLSIIPLLYVQSFQISKTYHNLHLVHFKTSTKLHSNANSNEANEDEVNPFEGFNPFEKKVVKNLNPLISSNNNISIRQLRMKELMNTLLDNVEIESDNDENLIAILDNHANLLLEPLIDDDAVIEKDSIYDVGMNKEERFMRYNEVMGERIEKAVNKSVKRVLMVMREYVLNHQI